MKRGGGGAKGAEFERRCCKALSLWVSRGKRDDLFWRSAMSGGRATIGRRAGKNRSDQAGDIVATSKEGHALTSVWLVECKSYRDLNFRGALLKGIGKLAQFWQEASEEAAAVGKLPMLIAKENQQQIVLLVRAPYTRAPGDGQYLAFSDAHWIARLQLLGADVYLFEDVIARPFQPKDAPMRSFLKPGELQRILDGRKVIKRGGRPKIGKGKARGKKPVRHR